MGASRDVQNAIENHDGDDTALAHLFTELEDMDGYSAEARAGRLLSGLGFTAEEFQKTVTSFSGGWRVRLALAQALMCPSDLLLLDEPTNGLDPTQTLQMRELIRKLAETSTVIVSTHILSEVEAVCDRVLMVRSGKLVLDSRLDELTEAGVLNVRTSLAVASLQAILQPLDGVKGFQFQPHGNVVECRVKLAEQATANQVSAELARKIIEAGGELYQLHREQRDLETLFRELNSGEGMTNAA